MIRRVLIVTLGLAAGTCVAAWLCSVWFSLLYDYGSGVFALSGGGIAVMRFEQPTSAVKVLARHFGFDVKSPVEWTPVTVKRNGTFFFAFLPL